jgi:hypothetical protein
MTRSINGLHLIFFYVSRLKWQVVITLILTGAVGACMYCPVLSGINIEELDRATFVAALTAVATIIALFCSLSIAWILFASQQYRTERLAAYDTMKACLRETQHWLLDQKQTPERLTCLQLALAIDKFDLDDLPQVGLHDTPEYTDYARVLSGLDDVKDQTLRDFLLMSSVHFGYVEHLLNRIGVSAIGQIIAKNFIDALKKGIGIVIIAVLVLIASMGWYNAVTKPWFILATCFCGVFTCLLLVEIWFTLLRHYDDELVFVEEDTA